MTGVRHAELVEYSVELSDALDILEDWLLEWKINPRGVSYLVASAVDVQIRNYKRTLVDVYTELGVPAGERRVLSR